MAPLFLGIICASVLWMFLIDNTTAIQITGASGGVNFNTGERPLRLEISNFATSGAAYDLFVLALLQLQNTNQTDPLSYFQICGIHGYPRIPWDGVVGHGHYPGYCIHSAVPFPIWHRPYMALYEQAVWINAQAIAQTYPLSVRDQYTSAAITLRVPYWDWAAQPYLPDAASRPTVSINTPNGNSTVTNPLYAYTFLGTSRDEDIPLAVPMANMTHTVRHLIWETQQSNQTQANAYLSRQAPSILSLTYQLLTSVTNYTSFSCVSPGGGANTDTNIENIHNNIHISVGGVGQMAYPEVAAFDPIFYLHHANVDRIFAMWQALNPESYIQPTINPYGSYYEVKDFVDSGNSSLAPFHSNNGTTMYTSDDVRGTLVFGYTYPELVDWNISAIELASNLRAKINLLYNPSALTPSFSSATIGKPLVRAADSAHAFDHITFQDAKTLGMNNLNMQWNIDVRILRYTYNSPFVIDFFMGEAELDPRLRGTAANLIGSHAHFIASNISTMFPDGPPQVLVQGHVSLSHTLAAGLNRGLIRDLNPRNVVPLLRQQLKWNARSTEGCDIDVSTLEGLSVIVTSKVVKPTTSGDEFPIYGQLHYWPMATRGKTGGRRKFDR